MAPIGAYITKYQNFSLSELGPNYSFENLIKFPLVYDLDLKNNTIKTTIQYVDSFGNGTTTIPTINNKIENSDLSLEDGLKVSFIIREKTYEAIFTTHFASMPIDSVLLITGSTGYLEISVNQGNASKILDFKVGDIITLKLK